MHQIAFIYTQGIIMMHAWSLRYSETLRPLVEPSLGSGHYSLIALKNVRFWNHTPNHTLYNSVYILIVICHALLKVTVGYKKESKFRKNARPIMPR